MSRRIDIELTSARPDGSWTWRAAGAREPKGVLTDSLLPSGSKPGDVLRAEVEQEIDGIQVIAVLPPKSSSPLPDRIEIRGQGPVQGGVSSELRRPLRDGDTRERKPRRDGDKRPGGGAGRRPSGPRPTGGERSDRHPPRERSERPPRREAPEPKPKPKRLTPARTHRDAWLAGLNDAERRIAEQLMTGGINAVRQSLEAQSRALEAEGKPAVDPAPILTLADDLRAQVTAVEWRDFAEAAIASANEIALRDLRGVVAKADGATRDDETRLLAAQLREALDARVAAMKEHWVSELTAAVREGRLVRALKISGQPPEPGSRFPEEIATELAAAASTALNADTMPDRWGVLAEAVAMSSVRRNVVPASAPKEVTDALKATVTKIATRVPAIATCLGIDVPAPAKPEGRGPRPPRKAVGQKKLAQKPSAPIARPANAPGPRVMIGGRAIPPPPRPTASHEGEDVAGPVGDDVAVEPLSADVPAGNDVPDAGVDSSAPVVGGVADEQDVAVAEPEGGEN
ncbi:MAG: hypothetical protein QOK28_1076 [Actinomycetota bacterium]|jgi:hypothetical protein